MLTNVKKNIIKNQYGMYFCSMRVKLFQILIILLLSNVAYSQGGWIQPNVNYGTKQFRISLDSTIFLPTGCGAPSGTSSLHAYNLKKAAFYYDSCGHKGYFFDPALSLWLTSGGGQTLQQTLQSGSTININDTIKYINQPYTGYANSFNLLLGKYSQFNIGDSATGWNYVSYTPNNSYSSIYFSNLWHSTPRTAFSFNSYTNYNVLRVNDTTGNSSIGIYPTTTGRNDSVATKYDVRQMSVSLPTDIAYIDSFNEFSRPNQFDSIVNFSNEVYIGFGAIGGTNNGIEMNGIGSWDAGSGNLDIGGVTGDITDGTWHINPNGESYLGSTLRSGMQNYGYDTWLGSWDEIGNGTQIHIDDNSEYIQFVCFDYSGSPIAQFNGDGSGYLANNNLQWDGSGAIGNLNAGTWQINNDGSSSFAGIPTGGVGWDVNSNTYILNNNLVGLVSQDYQISLGNQTGWGFGNNTGVIIDDNLQTQLFKAANGFQFTGGSTISSDGDLSIMNGNAGIFSNGDITNEAGNIFKYDGVNGVLYLAGDETYAYARIGVVNNIIGTLRFISLWDDNPSETLNLDASGNLKIKNGALNLYDISSNNTTLSTDGVGQFYIADKTSGIQVLSTGGYGDLQVTNRLNEIQTFVTNGSGDLGLFETSSGQGTFYVDRYGLQSVDAVSGLGTMSPQWLLGGVTVGVPTLTTPIYINLMIDGVPTQIQGFQ